ncbi:IclR family transcriptional regulator [Paracoccus sp. AS002]|uniref:IclR family transcriptional regulator n=1 Tax=Paracoccus sp. AS002 TaxID=3019545 RepID=UPI0023E7EAC2|nr:IclR family transcriptional regulator [Paracoccus sp. AS002]MDF3907573.1 IclR family transcriptional regulator [Paracoccus sp. AS002]
MSSTLAKGLKLLETLCVSREPIGITELAKAADLNLSAVQRLLGTLVQQGYAEQNHSSRKYSATLATWEIGSLVLRDHLYLRAVHPVLRQAAQNTGFTAHFILNAVPFVTYFDKVEGPLGLTYSSVPGTSVPMTLTAAGLAIISFMPQDQIDLLRRPAERSGAKFEGFDPAALAPRITDVRERRYATSESGFRKGVNSVAAPIWGSDGLVCGALALTADENELRPDVFTTIGQRVIRWAEEATIILGGSPYPRTFYE